MFGLLGLAALPVAAEAKPQAPKQTFLKGQVVPRVRQYAVPACASLGVGELPSHSHSFTSPGHTHNYSTARTVREVDYQIFDGVAFVPLESEAGQRVISDLS
jgi:hypothetical protein